MNFKSVNSDQYDFRSKTKELIFKKTEIEPNSDYDERMDEFGESEEKDENKEENPIADAENFSLWNIHPIYSVYKANDFEFKISSLAALYTTLIIELTILSIAYEFHENYSDNDVNKIKKK